MASASMEPDGKRMKKSEPEVISLVSDSDSETDEFHDARQTLSRQSTMNTINTTNYVQPTQQSTNQSVQNTQPQSNQSNQSRAVMLRSKFQRGRANVDLLHAILRDHTTVTITIINDTNCILNIALKTVTPFAFENRVMPGFQCTKRVPRFVYTIEARVWTGNNEFKIGKDIVEPVAFVALTAASLTTAVASRAALIAARAPAWAARVVRVGRPMLQLGRAVLVAKTGDKVRQDLTSNPAIRSHGWNFTKSRVLAIRGGPAVSIVESDDGELRQFIELTNEHFDNFTVVEPFPNGELLGR